MGKYLLLLIPVIYFRGYITHFAITMFEGLVNITIVTLLLFILLLRTRLVSISDWLIILFFSIYFCFLYEKTIYFLGFIFDSYSLSITNIFHVLNTINFIPLKGIYSQLNSGYNFGSILYQISGNLLMLAPFSFTMLYFGWTKNYLQTFLYSLNITLAIESIQLIQSIFHAFINIGLKRSTDIDDIMLNLIGSCIGMIIFWLWSTYYKNRIKITKRNIQQNNHQ